MLHHLFDAFSILFWLSIAVLFVIEVAIAENESTGWGFLWLAIWVALAVSFTDFNPLPWIVAHWILLPILIGLYVGLGVGYAFFRWALLIRDPDQYSYDRKPLNPASYKDRIISWMMWWPPSLTWYLLRWPRKLFTALYGALTDTFNRMAQAAVPKR